MVNSNSRRETKPYFPRSPLYWKRVSKEQRRAMWQAVDEERRQQEQSDSAAPEASSTAPQPEPPSLGRTLVQHLEQCVRMQRSLVPLLPAFFRIRGQPVTLRRHFAFEPLFTLDIPQRCCFLAGRQVGKSQNLSMLVLLRGRSIPYFHQLILTPFYEMIRRLSSNYVAELLATSPILKEMSRKSLIGSVLQRDLVNGSRLIFSFARTDPTRTRGVDISGVVFDEIQDIGYDIFAVIGETLSGSEYGFINYSGTPKTLNNTANKIYTDSSMARWVTPCQVCGHWNVPTLEQDLERMLGPVVIDRTIGPESPGTVCAKCSRPIFPDQGHFFHFVKELKHTFPGYHVPQFIMPHHYASHRRWLLLQAKRMGYGGFSTATFMNEVCGIPYDVATTLVSLNDLKRAAVLHPNRLDQAREARRRRGYKRVVMGVDWGGGGKDFISFTSAAVVGLLPDGVCEVIYGWRSPNQHDYVNEVAALVYIARELEVSHIADDMGSGTSRSEFFLHAGLRPERLCSVLYLGPCRGPMLRKIPFNPETGLREHFQLEKTRSLTSTCEMIRSGFLRFFADDYVSTSMPGLLRDFLNLVENQVEVVRGSNVLTIVRDPLGGPDDFAHAVNFAVHLLYFLEGQRYPESMQALIRRQIEESLEKRLSPDRPDFDFSRLVV